MALDNPFIATPRSLGSDDDPLQSAVGHVAASWAGVEYFASQMIDKAAAVSEAVGPILREGLRFQDVVKRTVELMNVTGVDASIVERYWLWSKTANRLRVRCDQMLHDHWGARLEGELFSLVARIERQNVPPTLDDALALGDEIDAAMYVLFDILWDWQHPEVRSVGGSDLDLRDAGSDPPLL